MGSEMCIRDSLMADYILCSWCQANNPQGSTQCAVCGAPLNAKEIVSDSGWREAPRLREMEEFAFSSSTLQVSGKNTPVAEINLSSSDSVYYEPHAMLVKEPSVPVHAMTTAGGRRVGGMPFYLTIAGGPGRVAFSRNSPGELVVMPIHTHTELDVREHAFVLASHTVNYDFVRIKGLANMLHGGAGGMYLDRFKAEGEPGIILIHGAGDVMQKTLKEGEKILVEPGKFLYKDSSVTLNTVPLEGVKTGMFGRKLFVGEFVGPGRVGIQSSYHHNETE